MAHHAINKVIWDAPLSYEPSTEEALQRYVEANVALNQRIQLAAQVLERVIQSPRLANEARAFLADDAAIAPILAAHFDVDIS